MIEVFDAIIKNPGQAGFTSFLILLVIYLLKRERDLHSELVTVLNQYQKTVEESVTTLTILAQKLEK